MMTFGTEVVHSPCVVVGAGIAGLTAALGHGDCVVLSKTTLGDGSSRLAQGGIAAAIGPGDTPSHHAADTVAVAAGLADEGLAELVAGAGPGSIRWLVQLGARFDRAADGALDLGREAGHTRRRIVHADGAATGAEIMRTLRGAVRARPDIEVLEHTHALDLIVGDGRVEGILAIREDGRHLAVLSPVVVLATGGIGRVYRHTTNPPEVAADGLAMAVRAGVHVRDLEFVQFHPTALAVERDPMPLLSEALRGDGAVLLDASGRRFMVDVHRDAELAPRDVVAREIWRRAHHGPVFLDCRPLGAGAAERFPTLAQIAVDAGLDLAADPLPVAPAEHYHMGGVAVDDRGRTSMPGLYACGEVASTGLHGANRLASNSLLEGLVFGARVAEDALARNDTPTATVRLGVPVGALAVESLDQSADVPPIDELRGLMWERAGLVRDRAGLRQAGQRLAELRPALARHLVGRNLVVAAEVVVHAALERRESRGSHHRSDHPHLVEPARHTLVRPTPSPSAVLDVEAQPAAAR